MPHWPLRPARSSEADRSSKTGLPHWPLRPARLDLREEGGTTKHNFRARTFLEVFPWYGPVGGRPRDNYKSNPTEPPPKSTEPPPIGSLRPVTRVVRHAPRANEPRAYEHEVSSRRPTPTPPREREEGKREGEKEACDEYSRIISLSCFTSFRTRGETMLA